MRVRAWEDGPLRLKDAGLGTLEMNAGQLESMSDGLNQPLTEQGHTQLDSYPSLELGEILFESKIGLVFMKEEKFIIV